MTILNTNYLKQIIAKIELRDSKKLTDLISNIIIKDNNIGFSIDISEITKEEGEVARARVMKLLSNIENIGKITVVLTKNTDPDRKLPKKQLIDKVKNVFLVASGKGGVGKSTIAALIAQQLRDRHYKVGIVDTDIYGPSLPQIFGINERPIIEDKMMIPPKVQKVQINSIGFLVDNNSALAWRGPMASKAIYQLLSLTKWDDLDYLVIDTPPGTGDIHLSIIDNYHIDKVFIVTTPQKISSIDASKAIDLYQKFGLKIGGIIENMSYYADETGKKGQIFSGDGGESLAKLHNIPLIAKVPISVSLAKACDEGENLSNVIQLPLDKIID